MYAAKQRISGRSYLCTIVLPVDFALQRLKPLRQIYALYSHLGSPAGVGEDAVPWPLISCGERESESQNSAPGQLQYALLCLQPESIHMCTNIAATDAHFGPC
jgi:hypothetical protein